MFSSREKLSGQVGEGEDGDGGGGEDEEEDDGRLGLGGDGRVRAGTWQITFLTEEHWSSIQVTEVAVITDRTHADDWYIGLPEAQAE